MYKTHERFQGIADNEKIWRFMDLAKFCSILEKNALFFARPEKFSDPWEGFAPRKNYSESSYDNMPAHMAKTVIDSMNRTVAHVRNTIAVNCWHINEFESEAFWRNYSDKGIAIQSTFEKLKAAFRNEENYNIYIGKVEYKDPDFDIMKLDYIFNYILWKRKSFEHEKELRAVIWEIEHIPEKDGSRPFDHINGQGIIIDPMILIENIYTTPFTQDEWFNQVVANILKKYGLNIIPQKSKLMDVPRF